jgi:hypothetical protein
MTKENKPDDRTHRKPLQENPFRKSDQDRAPLSDSPTRRIFDVTDTRPSPENPHRDTNERDKK